MRRGLAHGRSCGGRYASSARPSRRLTSLSQLSIFTELQDAHASLLTRHAYVKGTYEEYDRRVYDFCKEGLAHFRFHPLPTCPSAAPSSR